MKCLLDHIVLNVTDMEDMLSFYVDILGLATERLGLYRNGKVPFPSVRLGEDTVVDFFPAGMWSADSEAGPCGMHLNHFCLAMGKPAWDELSVRLAQEGVAIETGPVKRWGAHGTGISIYFRDPENNLIEARYYRGENDRNRCLLDS
jgi:catechol 2,3-dioxygenase-like lactoylglutathione lyase family enzyme